jgi:hypothetical protein
VESIWKERAKPLFERCFSSKIERAKLIISTR